MPTKKELQEKIKELEEKKKELEEENKKLENEIQALSEIGQDFYKFIQLVNLVEIFHKAMNTNTLLIEEVKEAVNKLKCAKCSDSNCKHC